MNLLQNKKTLFITVLALVLAGALGYLAFVLISSSWDTPEYQPLSVEEKVRVLDALGTSTANVAAQEQVLTALDTQSGATTSQEKKMNVLDSLEPK